MMASAAWIVVFAVILIADSATSDLHDFGSNAKCYCGLIENVCPTNLNSLRDFYSLYSPTCTKNEVRYCNIPDGSISKTCGLKKMTMMSDKNNGQAKFGEHPWQAAILKRGVYYGSNVYLGSGVLISKKHVLTVVQKIESVGLSDLIIRLGEYDLTSNEERCGYQDYLAANVIKHPSYNANAAENNIAMIILNKEVPLATSPHISSACLPSGVSTYERCWVAGWGSTQELTTGDSRILRDVSVPIVDRYNCQRSIQPLLNFNEKFPETVICAGEYRMESCMIDAGSPLVCVSSLGRWEVVGLLSASIGCHQNTPSLYTDVSKFTYWIYQQVFDNQ